MGGFDVDPWVFNRIISFLPFEDVLKLGSTCLKCAACLRSIVVQESFWRPMWAQRGLAELPLPRHDCCDEYSWSAITARPLFLRKNWSEGNCSLHFLAARLYGKPHFLFVDDGLMVWAPVYDSSRNTFDPGHVFPIDEKSSEPRKVWYAHDEGNAFAQLYSHARELNSWVRVPVIPPPLTWSCSPGHKCPGHAAVGLDRHVVPEKKSVIRLSGHGSGKRNNKLRRRSHDDDGYSSFEQEISAMLDDSSSAGASPPSPPRSTCLPLYKFLNAQPSHFNGQKVLSAAFFRIEKKPLALCWEKKDWNLALMPMLAVELPDDNYQPSLVHVSWGAVYHDEEIYLEKISVASKAPVAVGLIRKASNDTSYTVAVLSVQKNDGLLTVKGRVFPIRFIQSAEISPDGTILLLSHAEGGLCAARLHWEDDGGGGGGGEPALVWFRRYNLNVSPYNSTINSELLLHPVTFMVTSAVCSGDCRYFAIGTTSGEVHVIGCSTVESEINTHAESNTFSLSSAVWVERSYAHTSPITGLLFCGPNSTFLAVGQERGCLRIYDCPLGRRRSKKTILPVVTVEGLLGPVSRLMAHGESILGFALQSIGGKNNKQRFLSCGLLRFDCGF